MPLPIISHVARVTFDWTSVQYSRRAANVMHFDVGTMAEDDIFDVLDANVVANMWTHTTVDSVIDQVAITKLDGTSPTKFYATGGASKWKGTASSGDTSPQVATIIKLRTAKRGRSYRGRVFLPWTRETAEANGVLNSGVQTNLQSAWDTFITDITPDIALGVASYLHSSWDQVDSLVAETFLATQRRRQPRG